MQPEYQKELRTILDAALAAVAPDGALARHVRVQDDHLLVSDRKYALGSRRLLVVGAGKGAAPMAAALEILLGKRITQGQIIVKEGHGLPLKHIRIVEASHPMPDERGEHATHEMLRMAHSAQKDDLVICLVTGGASALTPALAEGITLADMRRTTELLLKCSATIHEVNAVRKHLSVYTGGRLAAAAAPAPMVALLVSDVVGDNLDVIGSGPTVPDASTFAQCLEITERFGIRDQLPQPVLQRLTDGAAGVIAETPKADDPIFAQVQTELIATNKQALEAAAKVAKTLGYAPRILTTSLSGDSRTRALELTEQACQAADTLKSGDAPLCLLFGGETTLNVRGTGMGGRNQEMAVVAAGRLRGRKGIAAVFADTDGTDGPTDAAGGFASGSTLDAAAKLGLDPQPYLDNNDCYNFLDKCGHLLVTGPTLTNVTGVGIFLVHPQ
ncbi:MAG: glycerate kinase [Deltaproteobacteria bacterium]|jgi:hydroxypyruvate reductase|nr:glycerate kinase [Deltaproteobacteria bacterium]